MTSVAYMPDGNTIVAGSLKGTIVMFDTHTDHTRRLSHEGARRKMATAVSPDGQRIASASSDTICVWDVASGRQTAVMKHGRYVLSVAYSPDGALIASSGTDRTVQLWDAATGTAIGYRLAGHSLRITCVLFSPDGTCIASRSEDGTIRLWDSTTGAAMGTLGAPDAGDYVCSICFSPDGALLVSGDVDGKLIVWDVRRRLALLVLQGYVGDVGCVTFSPSGTYIASASDDHAIRVWNAQNGQQIGPPLTGHESAVRSIAFSPDGATLVSTSNDWTLRVWDLSPQDTTCIGLRPLAETTDVGPQA